jgi:tetratricopeptide (TPR) repeat protein
MSQEVKPLQPVDPQQFVELAQPLLEKKDLGGLLALLRSRWSSEQITSLLSGRHEDARKVAALALSLVGCKHCIKDLLPRLKDPDPVVNQMAEHALWSIWLRGGACAEANHEVCRGTQALNRRDFEQAADHFTHAIELDPTFAEAYNQRALVRFLQERYDESIADCRRAVEHMPCHFGAWASMAHCHVHKGRMTEAVQCYEKALAINPHLDSIREVLESLRGSGSPSTI